jgi:hypothetical protein
MPLRSSNNPDGSSQQENQENQDSTSGSNTTTDPQDQVTDDSGNQEGSPEDYYAFLEKTVVENTKRMKELADTNRRLQQDVSSIRSGLDKKPPTQEAPPAPTKTPEEERAEFFNNPREMFRAMMREELKATVEPLRQEVQSILADRNKGSLLSQFENDPRFKSILSDKLARYHVENVLQQQVAAGVTIDQNIVMQTVVQIAGLKMTGMLPEVEGLDSSSSDTSSGNGNNGNRDGGSSGNQDDRRITSSNSTPSNRNNMPPVPAHLRPSPPAGPRNNNQQGGATRTLNENEKRIARESKLSDKEYIELYDMPASEVKNWVPEKERQQNNNQGGGKK